MPLPNTRQVFLLGTLSTGNRRQRVKPVPLSGVQEISNTEPVDTKMPWDEVSTKLTYSKRQDRKTAPSKAYADAFRNGATLFPQPLVVFERPNSRALGNVYFKTNPGKNTWKGQDRNGKVEERFVKSALFSRRMLPFGMIAPSYVIAPYSEDGRNLESVLPQGDDAADFRLYWDNADRDWRRLSGPKPPDTLLDQIDHQGKLSSQLSLTHKEKVVYQRSGTWLMASVIPATILADGTLNWYASPDARELHYLTAIFNSPSLAQFFRDYCRAADRHFQMGPVENLPIAKFDPRYEHHQNLASQSLLAHQNVAALVEERLAANRKISRTDILNDPNMRLVLKSVDESVREILPEFCS